MYLSFFFFSSTTDVIFAKRGAHGNARDLVPVFLKKKEIESTRHLSDCIRKLQMLRWP